MDLFGATRSRVERNHALIGPDSFVRSPLHGWTKTQGVILIAPQMGAKFTQYLALMEAGALSAPAAGGVERVAYVLEGSIVLGLPDTPARKLTAGGYVFVPAGTSVPMCAETTARLNIFEKHYVPLPGENAPILAIGQEQTVEGTPFMGDEAALLQVLLPDVPAFDLAVNRFRFQPGSALPLVEIHVMEHGLLMLEGQGVYRLGDSWYPVRTATSSGWRPIARNGSSPWAKNPQAICITRTSTGIHFGNHDEDLGSQRQIRESRVILTIGLGNCCKKVVVPILFIYRHFKEILAHKQVRSKDCSPDSLWHADCFIPKRPDRDLNKAVKRSGSLEVAPNLRVNCKQQPDSPPVTLLPLPPSSCLPLATCLPPAGGPFHFYLSSLT